MIKINFKQFFTNLWMRNSRVPSVNKTILSGPLKKEYTNTIQHSVPFTKHSVKELQNALQSQRKPSYLSFDFIISFSR